MHIQEEIILHTDQYRLNLCAFEVNMLHFAKNKIDRNGIKTI